MMIVPQVLATALIHELSAENLIGGPFLEVAELAHQHWTILQVLVHMKQKLIMNLRRFMHLFPFALEIRLLEEWSSVWSHKIEIPAHKTKVAELVADFVHRFCHSLHVINHFGDPFQSSLITERQMRLIVSRILLPRLYSCAFGTLCTFESHFELILQVVINSLFFR